ncbi:hypothetical protein BCR37DRAFT_393191 [Protomyces lactucae-debilis]|uniref:Uncharacterized protein n=1 Tax=Protomyces lactucae-debilis TaxID=2754530 RepID=A0A1Y2FBQ0_PROLT|nr:uncharacterized protein BCR37DRAFT_393191 [Protomyces lactucae-debilis]ORY81311.1 hypothetical protein BCR37DRAFT_393191 [Protomyces lactucae-debilis]
MTEFAGTSSVHDMKNVEDKTIRASPNLLPPTLDAKESYMQAWFQRLGEDIRQIRDQVQELQVAPRRTVKEMSTAFHLPKTPPETVAHESTTSTECLHGPSDSQDSQTLDRNRSWHDTSLKLIEDVQNIRFGLLALQQARARDEALPILLESSRVPTEVAMLFRASLQEKCLDLSSLRAAALPDKVVPFIWPDEDLASSACLRAFYLWFCALEIVSISYCPARDLELNLTFEYQREYEIIGYCDFVVVEQGLHVLPASMVQYQGYGFLKVVRSSVTVASRAWIECMFHLFAINKLKQEAPYQIVILTNMQQAVIFRLVSRTEFCYAQIDSMDMLAAALAAAFAERRAIQKGIPSTGIFYDSELPVKMEDPVDDVADMGDFLDEMTEDERKLYKREQFWIKNYRAGREQARHLARAPLLYPDDL